MLNESRLLNFLSQEKNISLQFLEGQKLIHDLALTHNVKQQGFSYFRDIVLTTQPLMYLLKPQESFGLYIDSEHPFFRYKVEMSFSGQMRTLLLPQDFNQNPEKITGLCRLAKITPSQQVPYTSIIELNNIQLRDLANEILSQSYQIEGQIYLSNYSDQSILITKLPTKEELPSVNQYWLEIKKEILEIFKHAHNNTADIVKEMKKLNFLYLGEREVAFKCNCSLNRMIQGIRSLASGDLDNVFEGKPDIVVNCDYCHKSYTINRIMLAH